MAKLNPKIVSAGDAYQNFIDRNVEIAKKGDSQMNGIMRDAELLKVKAIKDKLLKDK